MIHVKVHQPKSSPTQAIGLILPRALAFETAQQLHERARAQRRTPAARPADRPRRHRQTRPTATRPASASRARRRWRQGVDAAKATAKRHKRVAPGAPANNDPCLHRSIECNATQTAEQSRAAGKSRRATARKTKLKEIHRQAELIGSLELISWWATSGLPAIQCRHNPRREHG